MKHPITEQFLDRGGWHWEYREAVALATIDLAASLDNPARLDKRLDEDRVVNYAIAMLDGIEFPAIVLLRLDTPQGASEYQIATGCHRARAAEQAAKVSFDAYVVSEPDTYRREVLIRQLNTIEGHGLSIRDQILQLLQIHEKYPSHSLAQLAREWNLKPSTVQSVHLEQQAIRRAARFGFEFSSRTHRLAQKTIVRLHGIHNDAVFAKAAEFAFLSGVGNSELEDMAREIKKTRDEQSGLAVVEKYAAAIASRRLQTQARTARISPNPGNKLIANCRRVAAVLDGGIEPLHLAALSRPDLARSLLEDLIANFKRVIGELDRIARSQIHLKSRAAKPDQPELHA